MINTVKLNLLDISHGIIAHGCNAQGVMGAGVAKQIKIKYPTAFEIGSSKKEIYLPWTNFNKNNSQSIIPDKHPAYEIARDHHLAWDRLNQPVKKLMARNVLQVLGNNLDSPSLFMVCYTKDGCESHVTRTSKTGGTGLAISVASKAGIPIFNLKNCSSLDKLIQFTGIEI